MFKTMFESILIYNFMTDTSNCIDRATKHHLTDQSYQTNNNKQLSLQLIKRYDNVT